MNALKLWKVTCAVTNLATHTVRLADGTYVDSEHGVIHIAADSLAEVERLVGTSIKHVTACGPVFVLSRDVKEKP